MCPACGRRGAPGYRPALLTDWSGMAYRLDTWPLPPAPAARAARGDGDSGGLPGPLAILAAVLAGITIGLMVLALLVLFVVN